MAKAAASTSNPSRQKRKRRDSGRESKPYIKMKEETSPELPESIGRAVSPGAPLPIAVKVDAEEDSVQTVR
jgi:hypothetical protein